MCAKISVIIPVWGVEKYIEKCARSLFEQTLDDIEFIFVNDCTPDNSIEVLKHVLKEYPNRKAQTKIISHEHNKGLPQARKTGFEASTGEYIIYCDSDDWVSTHMYETLLNEAERRQLDMVFCDIILVSDSETLWAPTYDSQKFSSELRNDILALVISNSLCTKLVKRDIYNKGIYFPTIGMDEDDVICSQLSFYSANVGYVKEVLYYHYDNPSSMTHFKSEEKRRKIISDKVINRKWIVSFLEKQNTLDLEDALYAYKWSIKLLVVGVDGQSVRNLYPEINSRMLFGKNTTFSRRIRNFLILFFPRLWYHLKRHKR